MGDNNRYDGYGEYHNQENSNGTGYEAGGNNTSGYGYTGMTGDSNVDSGYRTGYTHDSVYHTSEQDSVYHTSENDSVYHADEKNSVYQSEVTPRSSYGNNQSTNGGYRSAGEELTESIYRSVGEELTDSTYRVDGNTQSQTTDRTAQNGANESFQTAGAGYTSSTSGYYSTAGASQQTDQTQQAGQTSGSYTYQNNQRYSYNPYQGKEPKEKKKFKFKKGGFAAKLGKVAAIGLVFGLVAGVTLTGTTAVTSKLTGTKIPATGNSKTVTTGNDNIASTGTASAVTVTDVSDVAENVMPAIVQVTCVTVTEYQNWFGQVYQDESEGAGSGIIMSKDDKYLYIATNNHVVSGAKDITITFNDNSAVAAEIQGTDEVNDLAVVKVKLKDIGQSTMDSIKLATIGSSDDLQVGESAIVIGNALGYGQTVTAGVISAKARDVQGQDKNGNIVNETLIQTDAAINPGNSGGALLNIKGEVVGIVSSKLAATEIESTGYAIPISYANDIITGIVNGEDERSEETKGNGAYMGITGVDIDQNTATTYGMPTGVYVSQVISGTGAHEGGIQKGDVITKVDGQAVTAFKELQALIAKKNPGDKMKVTVQRRDMNNYIEKELDITLGEKTED